ncbi:MAG: biotin--[acetyl-CoA-carboxylase] ligase, partial [Actinomycetes bacterium]
VSTFGVKASLKWPNDVMVGSRKLCGVLCEVVPTPAGNTVVAGWGVNVDQNERELPIGAATSVLMAGGVVDRSGLLVQMLQSWERWYGRWERRDASVPTTYVEYSDTLGRMVRAQLPDGGQLEGLAAGISDSGGLVIADDGVHHEVAAADVVHLRAASP